MNSLASTAALIKSQLPEFDRITKEIRASGGYLTFSSPIVTLLSTEGLTAWSSFYEDPNKLKALTVVTLVGPKNIKKLERHIKRMDETQKAQLREKFKKQVLTQDSITLGADTFTMPTEDEWDSWIEDAIAGKDTEKAKNFYLLIYTVITQYANYLAVMAFARTMTTLVSMAIEGDDQCYFDAVRIDKTVLFGIPYFKSRLIRAQLEGDSKFLGKLSNAIRGTAIGTKISYRRLMFVFALLDDEGMLVDMELEQLLAICHEVGVTEIADTETLRKRRKYYRERTGRQIKF